MEKVKIAKDEAVPQFGWDKLRTLEVLISRILLLPNGGGNGHCT